MMSGTMDSTTWTSNKEGLVAENIAEKEMEIALQALTDLVETIQWFTERVQKQLKLQATDPETINLTLIAQLRVLTKEASKLDQANQTWRARRNNWLAITGKELP